MLAFLFRRLTAGGERGAALFATLTAEARQPHWYVEGKVPDTIDGRFAMLATVTAMAMVRLERDGAEGDLASVALTERFVQVMEAEHRELGIGDPSLGRKVRRLVGSLSRRVDLWRHATEQEEDWAAAAEDSLYKGKVSAGALRHSAVALREYWQRLERTSLGELKDGRIG